MTTRGLVSFFHLLKPGSNAPRSIHSLASRGEAWHLTEILGHAVLPLGSLQSSSPPR